MFDQLIGNPSIKKYLQKLLKSQAIPHALLFSGPAGVGKGCFARAFAIELLGEGLRSFHPDLHEYSPEGKIGIHSIETMRAFSEEVTLSPYQSKWKVFIIYEAERMLVYSANALLKTFEEPPPHTMIILVSSSSELLLPTILSRCYTIPFKAITLHEMIPWLQTTRGLDLEQSRTIARASKGSISHALKLLESQQDPFETFIVPVLDRGGFDGYHELTKVTHSIAEQIDALKSNDEEVSESDLTAVQRDQLEKLQAGAGAVQHAEQAHLLFEQISAWYRDMVLLHYHGDEQGLWHAKHRDMLVQAIQRGAMLEMDFVQDAVKEASTGLQRSVPLQNVLETLFIRLNLDRRVPCEKSS